MLTARMLNDDFELVMNNGKVMLNGSLINQEEIKGFIRAYDRWGRKDSNRIYSLSAFLADIDRNDCKVFILGHSCARSVYVALQVLFKLDTMKQCDPISDLSQVNSNGVLFKQGSGESNG